MISNLACILSHCDNNEKLIALENNIKTLKECGFDVLLSSHIPLGEKITSSVNYFIYDKSNPILQFPEKALVYWKSILIGDTFTSLDELLPDYGFTPYNQIKKIGAFCKELEYDNFTFINYDIKITPNMVEEFSNIKGNIVSKVKWKKDHNEYSPNLLLFSFSKQDFYKISSSINRKDYISHTNFSISGESPPPEAYLKYLLKDIEYKVFEEVVDDSFEFNLIKSTHLWDFNTENNYFSLFFDKSFIILYGLVKNIKFNIDGEDIMINKNTKLKKPMTSFSYYDSNNKLVNINHLLITDRPTAISY